MLTTFAIFTGNWVDAFQACAASVGVGLTTVFFLPALIIGFLIITNLFIAILLEAFGSEHEEAEDAKEADDAEVELLPTTSAAGDGDTHPVGAVSSGVKEPTTPCCHGAHKVAREIVEHAIFDNVVLGMIISSTICLALDVPRLDPTSDLKARLRLVNLWLTVGFVLEMALKVTAYGLCSPPPPPPSPAPSSRTHASPPSTRTSPLSEPAAPAYLASGWNRLDAFIVLVSILGLFADVIPAFSSLKSLRILRVLRPLRLLQRHAGMRLIITSLIKALPSVVEVTAVVLVFHVLFAIVGMRLFSGAHPPALSHPRTCTMLRFASARAPRAGGTHCKTLPEAHHVRVCSTSMVA